MEKGLDAQTLCVWNFLGSAEVFKLWLLFSLIVERFHKNCNCWSTILSQPQQHVLSIKKDLLRYLIPLYKGVSPLFSQKSVSLITIPIVYLQFIMKDPTLPPLLSLIAIPGHN